MRVSFYSGLAAVAVLATSVMAVQLECPGHCLAQPMLTSQVELEVTPAPTSTTAGAANTQQPNTTGTQQPTPTNPLLQTEKKPEQKIKELQDKVTIDRLTNEVARQEQEKKEKEQREAEKQKKEEIDPEIWLKQHPQKAKLEEIIKREAKALATKIIDQKKRDKKKAEESVEKKGTTKEEERGQIVREVAAAVAAQQAQQQQAAATPPNPPQYGVPVKVTSVPTQAKP